LKEKKTWIERVSDTEDDWVRASRLEREGRYEEASKYYLKDAEKERNPAMAALSYLSAAKCLAKVGKKEAAKYFRLAAENYRKYAEETVGISPTSAVWGYLTASKCYMWAEDEEKAKEYMEKARALADRLEIKPPSMEISGDVPLFKAYRRRRKSPS